MSYFEILVVGGGVAGATFALLAQREGYRVAVVEKRGELLRGASGAAGAFLFPKVGFDTPYTRFINQGIVEGLKFWKGEGVEMDQSGVLILPRDQRDFNKFEKYKPHLQLKWEEREFVTPTGEVEKGFFFPEGGVVEVGSVRKRLKEEVEVIPIEMEKLERVKGGWNINGRLRSKLVVLAMGAEGNRWLPPYLQINPIWGQRISLKT
jgi:glycine/D-amino acid oxidase-like deaminating enzyme